jgi:hypothetical protein
MAGLATFQDFERVGFEPYLRSRGGMGEIRRFLRSQLDLTLGDAEKNHYPFASILANYARGKNLHDVPIDLRGDVQRQAIDAFWSLAPDFTRLVYGSPRPETRQALLRALFLALPKVVLEQSDAVASTRVLAMVDVWLVAHAVLRSQADQPETLVHLTVRGLHRWRSGRLAAAVLQGTTYADFERSLPPDERRPFDDIEHLRAMLRSERDQPGGLLFEAITFPPEAASLQRERAKALREAMGQQGAKLEGALASRAIGVFPPAAAPAAQAALFYATVADGMR